MAAPGLRSVEDAGPPLVDPAVVELLGGDLVHVIEPEERRYNVGAFRVGGEPNQQPDIDVGHHLHIAQRHAVVKRDRDGLVWIRDVSRRTGCKTELLLEEDDTVDVAGWELLNLCQW